jgi:hypothetical protein
MYNLNVNRFAKYHTTKTGTLHGNESPKILKLETKWSKDFSFMLRLHYLRQIAAVHSGQGRAEPEGSLEVATKEPVVSYWKEVL